MSETRATIRTRPFGRSGVDVTEVGLGAWQLGGDCWGDVPDDRALRILRAAVDAGVRFIDTADVYGGGRSEALIGRFLRECGEALFVATKVGRFPEPGWPENFSFDVFARHTEASIERLGVEALDLTQLHSIPAEQYERGEVFRWLEKLQEQGKIRRWGVSVESMDEAMVCLREPGLASLQVIFNIFRQKPIDALFEAAREKGVAVIARLPLASGLLAGKFSGDSTFAANDHRGFNPDGEMFNVGETFAGLGLRKGCELADRLRPLLPQGVPMAQASLRWVLDHEAVTVVIPGASRPEQALANAAASAARPLGADLHLRLRDFYEQHVAEHIRGPY